MLLHGILDFVGRLSEVDQDGCAFPVRQRPHGFERRRVERVHRMRGDRRHDQLIARKSIEEGLRASKPLRGRPGIGDGKPDDRLPEHAAEPRLFCGAGDLLLEVVHVRVGRCPRLDHFERGEPRSRPHELRRDRLCLGRENVLLEPGHQREVVGETAVQDHRGVRMRVDQTGHDHLTGGVKGFPGVVPGGNGLRRVHGHDVAPGDCHGTRREHAPARIDGHHDPAGHDEGRRPARRLRRQDRGCRHQGNGSAEHGRTILSLFSSPLWRRRFV